MKYKWKPVLAAMLASFCLFSSPLTALATDNTVSTIEDEMVHNTEGAAEAGSAETQTGESETLGSLPVQLRNPALLWKSPQERFCTVKICMPNITLPALPKL